MRCHGPEGVEGGGWKAVQGDGMLFFGGSGGRYSLTHIMTGVLVRWRSLWFTRMVQHDAAPGRLDGRRDAGGKLPSPGH